jgi:hypothetical protein
VAISIGNSLIQKKSSYFESGYLMKFRVMVLNLDKSRGEMALYNGGPKVSGKATLSLLPVQGL